MQSIWKFIRQSKEPVNIHGVIRLQNSSAESLLELKCAIASLSIVLVAFKEKVKTVDMNVIQMEMTHRLEQFL